MCCETKIRYVLYFFEWVTVRNTQHREYPTAGIPNDQNTQQKSWVFWSLGILGNMTGIPNNGMSFNHMEIPNILWNIIGPCLTGIPNDRECPTTEYPTMECHLII